MLLPPGGLPSEALPVWQRDGRAEDLLAELFETTIVDADAVVLAVEVTSPSNAWSDRLVKPDAYARAGIPYYLRVDFERWPDDVGASCYALGPTGGYAETMRADEAGRMVFDRPLHVELDLPALARSTRYPRT